MNEFTPQNNTSENFSTNDLAQNPVIGGDVETGHIFADGFQNPPTPLLENGQPDLNEIARQSKSGERREVTTVAEAMNAEDGYHNTHMQNPELHPPREGEINFSIDAIKAALAKSDNKPEGDN